MLHQYMCPTLTLKSSVLFILLLEIIIFFISISLTDELKGAFLTPSIEALIDLGAKYPYEIQNGEIWLLISSLFLHANFLHLFWNMINLLIFGVWLESTAKTVRFLIIFFSAGFFGNFFGCLLSDMISVGASTSICGIIAGMLGYLFVKWSEFGNSIMKWQIVCLLSLMLIFSIFLTTKTTDVGGHFGGALFGFWTSLAVIEKSEGEINFTKTRTAGILVTIGGGFIVITVFFLARHPLPFII